MPCLQSKKILIHSIAFVYLPSVLLSLWLLLRRGVHRSEYQSVESTRAWAARNSLATERRNVSVYCRINTMPALPPFHNVVAVVMR